MFLAVVSLNDRVDGACTTMPILDECCDARAWQLKPSALVLVVARR